MLTKIDYIEIVKNKDTEIQQLNQCTKILKEHLDFLREKIKEKDAQIELFSEVMIAMDNQIKNNNSNSDPFKLCLN